MNPDNRRKLTFGIMLGPFPPWKKIVGWAKLVESLGFDKLWLPDHFVNPEDKDMDWFDCWCTLTALATQTEKIILGSLVSSMTLRTRPFWLIWRCAQIMFPEAASSLV